jgi:hydrogenase maturation protease
MTKAAAEVGIIGIGNTLAGDDGVGIFVSQRLRNWYNGRQEVFFHDLTGDFFEMIDLVDMAKRFLFIDALAGNTPGEIKMRMKTSAPCLCASFHQTDIGSVMRMAAVLFPRAPVPPWEIWGIVTSPPRIFHQGLSPKVADSAEALAVELKKEIDSLLTDFRLNAKTGY